jgi:hypothetical protein
MGAATIQQMADRVAALLDERLGLHGGGLADRLRRGGRLLPRPVRAAAARLAEAAEMARNPRLLMQVDEARVAQDYDLCVRHLGAVDVAGRRRGVLLGIATSILTSLLVVALAALGFAYWRGLL